MNRVAMKNLAKKQLQLAGSTPQIVTLIFLVCALLITGLGYAPELLNRLPVGKSGYLSSRVSIIGFLSASSVVFTLLLTALNMLLEAGYCSSILHILADGSTTTRDLLNGLKMPVRILAMMILKSLFTAFWCYLGMFLPMSLLIAVRYPNVTDPTVVMNDINTPAMTIPIFIIVAILMLAISYRYRMSLFVLLENPSLTPNQAIRTSVLITKKHRIELFLLDVSFLPWILLCVLTCGILLIWKLPYYCVTEGAAYHSLLADYQYRLASAIAFGKRNSAQENTPQFPDATAYAESEPDNTNASDSNE